VEPETILNAALQVFADHGVSGASIRAIAKVAGCDPGLIYYHYESKEGIFSALLDRLFRELSQRMDELLEASRSQPIQEQLRQLMHLIASLLRERGRALPGIVRGEVVRGAESFRPLVAQHIAVPIGRIRELFERGIASGELRGDLVLPLMPLFYMRPLVEIVELVPTMAPHLGFGDSDTLDVALTAWFDLFWRGIAADPSRSSQ